MTALTIDGREHPLRHLWLPEMSLSSSRAGRQAATYVLSIDVDTVLSTLAGAYDRYVEEAEEDDALTGLPDLLGQAGYPPLASVLCQPELLSELLGGYGLSDELFRAVLPPASGKMLGTWAVDTIETVRRDGERIVFTGTSYAF